MNLTTVRLASTDIQRFLPSSSPQHLYPPRTSDLPNLHLVIQTAGPDSICRPHLGGVLQLQAGIRRNCTLGQAQVSLLQIQGTNQDAPTWEVICVLAWWCLNSNSPVKATRVAPAINFPSRQHHTSPLKYVTRSCQIHAALCQLRD